jgi:hypothetical protein
MLFLFYHTPREFFEVMRFGKRAALRNGGGLS